MSSYDSNNRRSSGSRYDSSRSSRYSSDRASASSSSSRSRRSSSRSSSSRGGRITVSLRGEVDEAPRSSRQTYESQQRSRRARAEERESGRTRTEERESGRARTRERERGRSRSEEREGGRTRSRGAESSRSGSSRGSGARGSSARPRRAQASRNTPPVQQGYGDQTLFAPQRPLGGRIVLVLGAVLVLLLLFFGVNAIGSCVSGGFHKVKWGITTGEVPQYDLRATDVASLEKNSAITGVGLATGDESFSVSESDVGELSDAVYKVEKTAHCGFILLDIETGRALVYNPTEVMYCASAVKAPLCYYALTHPAGGTSGLTDTERTQIENAIQWSSNSDYFTLCETYMKEPYLQWIASYGVKYNAEQDGNFPSMSAASLGALWVEIYQYINGSSSDEKWFGGLFEKTETSFIREGLKNDKVTVREKAGWISDGETDAVTDAGIVTKDGRDYLMVIVTGQRDTDKGHKNVEDLAAALFAKRGLLGPNVTLTC